MMTIDYYDPKQLLDLATEQERQGLIYLASPYSNPLDIIREDRFQKVCISAAELMRMGFHIFSPIAHTHPIAQFNLPKDWEFWKKQDRLFIENSVALWVLMLSGWGESKGVRGELALAHENNLIVRYLRPSGGLD